MRASSSFVISFSLPLYAMVGAYDGVKAGLPVVAVIALGVTANDRGSPVSRRVERGDAEAVHPGRVVDPGRDTGRVAVGDRVLAVRGVYLAVGVANPIDRYEIGDRTAAW